MKNARIAFKIINGDKAIPPAYQEIGYHMVFDAKMEYFRYKARFFAGGHTTDASHMVTYAKRGFNRICDKYLYIGSIECFECQDG
jgi:hypothetical protein